MNHQCLIDQLIQSDSNCSLIFVHQPVTLPFFHRFCLPR